MKCLIQLLGSVLFAVNHPVAFLSVQVVGAMKMLQMSYVRIHLVSIIHTEEWMEVYTQHVELREKQVRNYKTFIGPVRKSTICKAAGCRRVFGRRGLIFCTEGCCEEQKRKDDPAPPFLYRDVDDENDASVILQKVLGDPPKNVRYRRLHPIDEENQLELTEETPPENQKYK